MKNILINFLTFFFCMVSLDGYCQLKVIGAHDVFVLPQTKMLKNIASENKIDAVLNDPLSKSVLEIANKESSGLVPASALEVNAILTSQNFRQCIDYFFKKGAIQNASQEAAIITCGCYPTYPNLPYKWGSSEKVTYIHEQKGCQIHLGDKRPTITYKDNALTNPYPVLLLSEGQYYYLNSWNDEIGTKTKLTSGSENPVSDEILGRLKSIDFTKNKKGVLPLNVCEHLKTKYNPNLEVTPETLSFGGDCAHFSEVPCAKNELEKQVVRTSACELHEKIIVESDGSLTCKQECAAWEVHQDHLSEQEREDLLIRGMRECNDPCNPHFLRVSSLYCTNPCNRCQANLEALDAYLNYLKTAEAFDPDLTDLESGDLSQKLKLNLGQHYFSSYIFRLDYIRNNYLLWKFQDRLLKIDDPKTEFILSDDPEIRKIIYIFMEEDLSNICGEDYFKRVFTGIVESTKVDIAKENTRCNNTSVMDASMMEFSGCQVSYSSMMDSIIKNAYTSLKKQCPDLNLVDKCFNGFDYKTGKCRPEVLCQPLRDFDLKISQLLDQIRQDDPVSIWSSYGFNNNEKLTVENNDYLNVLFSNFTNQFKHKGDLLCRKTLAQFDKKTQNRDDLKKSLDAQIQQIRSEYPYETTDEMMRAFKSNFIDLCSAQDSNIPNDICKLFGVQVEEEK